MKIINIKDLGADLEQITTNINCFLDMDTNINIAGIGAINRENKDVVVNAMKFAFSLNNNPEHKKERRAIPVDKEQKVVEFALMGMKKAELAKKFKVSTATISRILKRNNVKLAGGRPKIITERNDV